jgi:matrixin
LGAVLLSASAAQAEQSGIGSAGARGARWQKGSVTVSVEPSVDELGGEAFEGLVRAVSAWQTSPAELPTLVVQRGPADEVGFRRGGKNKNTVRYSPDGDPLANGALAITVITFDAHAREILDADIILNGEHKFGIFDDSPDHDTQNVYDLQNVLTHELGHLLGLGEDYDDEYATMYAFSQPGETIKRDLEPVDVDSVVSLYIEPFNTDSSAGCGGATIAAQSSEAWLWAALGLFGVGAVMRRRSARAAASSVSVLGALLIGMSTSSSIPSAGGLFAGDSVHEGLAANAVPSIVTGVESRWDGGLIVTKLTLRSEPKAGEAARQFAVETLGGQVGDLVQQVGHVMPPALGDELTLRFDDPSAAGGQRLLTVADVQGRRSAHP